MAKGIMWPRDDLPGKPGTIARWRFGRRLKDVLQGKGPDIFFGDIDGPLLLPRPARWSRWADIHGHPDGLDDETLPPLFPFADQGRKRYDFRTRRYKIPDVNTWSKAHYYRVSRGANLPTPSWVWDREGEAFPYNMWQEAHAANF